MKGSKILLSLLKNSGVEYISGIVGREAEAIMFDDEEDIDFILVRHEQTSGILAETFARKNKKAQACFSTIGPGVTNMATGVASAYKDGVPLIAIGMQVERFRRDEVVHQYLDNIAIMSNITKYSIEPNTIYELIYEFKGLSKYLYDEKPGPVFLSICIDILKEEYPDITEEDLKIDLYSIEKNKVDISQIEALCEDINNSKQPVILAGKEALDYGEEIRGFVEKYNIPIGTSLAGKGVISEEHNLSLGTVTKYWDKLLKAGLLEDVFKESDLIILLGYDYSEDLTEDIWNFGIEKKVYKIGKVKSGEDKYFNINANIVGDISEVLECIHNRNMIKKDIKIDINKIKDIKIKNTRNKIDTINPAEILYEIRKRLNPDDNLISDVGFHKHITALYYNALKPNTFFCSNGLATMGFGLPAGIGISLADKKNKTVVVCGDGSFHSVSQDLATCKKYNLPLVIVLFKDNSYGLIRVYQFKGHKKFEDSSTCFSSVDFALLAQANGCNGYSVNTIEEFIDEFEKALNTNKTTLIEVPVKYIYDNKEGK